MASLAPRLHLLHLVLPIRANNNGFQKSGSLDLLDYDGTAVWSTNTAAIHADTAALLDTASLVIMDQGGNRLWSSFNSPTDTLLPSQSMATNTRLISTKYWPTHNQSWANNGNRNQHGGLDSKGAFVAGDQLKFEASDLDYGIMRRLALDYDGNLRMYSLDMTTGSWSISGMLFARLCEIYGLCGVSSFEMTEPSDWSKGCMNRTSSVASTGFPFTNLPGTDFWGYQLNYNMNMCLGNENCRAFGYRMGTGQCYPKVLLLNGKNFTRPYIDIYLKVPKAGLPSKKLVPTINHACEVTEKEAYPASQMYKDGTSKFKFDYFLSSALTLFVIEVTLIIFGCWIVYKWERRPEITDEGYMIISSQFRRFSYKELQKATKCFQEELGSGGSEQGVLDDERTVAVKKLNDIVQGDQEFRSELSVIGRIYHMNLVRIWGFCAEKTNRLLITEFVKNGSLDRVLFDNQNSSPVLKWTQRYKIALGVAKGLAYLHHECLEWIIHCDVKPENILLDEDFEPKIADFGLVKLLGYIAPEWALNLPITGKADVYSYGVVLLELVKGMQVSSQAMEGEMEVEMAVRCSSEVLKEKLASEDHSWLLEFVDCRLGGEFDYSQAAMMVKIALSCVEEERRRRPNMSHVVEALLSLME
ncbi:hypothetical protein SETIT_4G061200v2 [Setaria italica]|uniref:non-specific serine/threonine protein kinase n=1 Tax=Setaria italica TaxID=4555 RepID=A0A368QRA7_SETIT|nr:hypothetical protein SETIT_4G061200v2 [Setaria italica]